MALIKPELKERDGQIKEDAKRNKKGYQQQQAKSSQLLDYVFENN